MNLEESLLVTLAEECMEVAKEAIKAVRFGPENTHMPTTPEARIRYELNDVLGAIELIRAHTALLQEPLWDRTLIDAKKAKVLEKMEQSKKDGRLQ